MCLKNDKIYTSRSQRTADRAARAAGTVYRVVAGTESLGINDLASIRTTTHDDYDHNDGTTNDGDNPVVKQKFPFKFKKPKIKKPFA